MAEKHSTCNLVIQEEDDDGTFDPDMKLICRLVHKCPKEFIKIYVPKMGVGNSTIREYIGCIVDRRKYSFATVKKPKGESVALIIQRQMEKCLWCDTPPYAATDNECTCTIRKKLPPWTRTQNVPLYSRTYAPDVIGTDGVEIEKLMIIESCLPNTNAKWYDISPEVSYSTLHGPGITLNIVVFPIGGFIFPRLPPCYTAFEDPRDLNQSGIVAFIKHHDNSIPQYEYRIFNPHLLFGECLHMVEDIKLKHKYRHRKGVPKLEVICRGHVSKALITAAPTVEGIKNLTRSDFFSDEFDEDVGILEPSALQKLFMEQTTSDFIMTLYQNKYLLGFIGSQLGVDLDRLESDFCELATKTFGRPERKPHFVNTFSLLNA